MLRHIPINYIFRNFPLVLTIHDFAITFFPSFPPLPTINAPILRYYPYSCSHLLGDKYVKALTEAMTPSGVITEEYKDGLDRLRQRLAISKESAVRLLALAARLRLAPVIKDLVDIWKSDAAGTQRAKDKSSTKDKSRDPISSEDNVLGYMEEQGAQVRYLMHTID